MISIQLDVAGGDVTRRECRHSARPKRLRVNHVGANHMVAAENARVGVATVTHRRIDARDAGERKADFGHGLLVVDQYLAAGSFNDFQMWQQRCLHSRR